MATTAQRQHVGQVLAMLERYAGQLDYPPGDVRTWQDAYTWKLTEQEATHLLALGHRLQSDCSEFCPWVLRCAGLWPWPDCGYTGSHLERLPVYSDPRHALTGALAVFGPGAGHHEAIVWHPDPKGGNPVLASHGHAGFDVVTLRELEASQTAEGYPGVRMLSIAHL